jgi:hypothetical protein
MPETVGDEVSGERDLRKEMCHVPDIDLAQDIKG